MTTILSVAVIITLLSLSVFQAFRNRRTSGYVDVKSEIMPRMFFALAAMISCGLFCTGTTVFRLLFDIVIAVICISPLILSVRPSGRLPFHIGFLPYVIPLCAICHILCAAGVLKTMRPSAYMVLSALAATAFCGMYIWMLWRRLRDVKAVMKSGNVWSFVTLCVDCIYVLSPLMTVSVLYSVHTLFPSLEFPAFVAIVLLVLQVVAVAARVSYDSAFVLLHNHERVIVESMKISHMEVSAVSDPRGEEQYKELYERIVLYFEMSKPYLDGNLTINDVVKVVYSNKVYISKAICHYTGRNFRQFVNYHRVIYSIDLFRSNLELKVTELAEKCGFNTVVSYTMAFRLFMNETPSEWCRKERSRILKTKK